MRKSYVIKHTETDTFERRSETLWLHFGRWFVWPYVTIIETVYGGRDE